jgi:hypothetical protein
MYTEMKQRRQEMRQIWCRDGGGLNPPSGNPGSLSDISDLNHFLQGTSDMGQAALRYMS